MIVKHQLDVQALITTTCGKAGEKRMKTNTSEDEKTVHHECISAEWAELRETIRVMSTNEGKLHARIAELETERSELVRYGDVWKQQWEEMRDTMWKPAMDKLARVEALPAHWRKEWKECARGNEVYMTFEDAADELDEALK